MVGQESEAKKIHFSPQVAWKSQIWFSLKAYPGGKTCLNGSFFKLRILVYLNSGLCHDWKTLVTSWVQTWWPFLKGIMSQRESLADGRQSIPGGVLWGVPRPACFCHCLLVTSDQHLTLDRIIQLGLCSGDCVHSCLTWLSLLCLAQVGSCCSSPSSPAQPGHAPSHRREAETGWISQDGLGRLGGVLHSSPRVDRSQQGTEQTCVTGASKSFYSLCCGDTSPLSLRNGGQSLPHLVAPTQPGHRQCACHTGGA